MPKFLALWLCVGFVAFLFALDLRQKGGSFGAWLATAYVAMISSRAVSSWFDLGVTILSPEDYLEGSPMDRNIFIGFLVVGVLLLLKRRANWDWASGRNRWIIVFIVYAGLSVLWSDYTFVALKRWIKMLGLVVMAMVVLTEEDPIQSVRWIFRKTAYFLIPFSILLIKYFPEFGRGYSYWNGAQFYTGVTGNKNSLGIVCFVYGIFFVWDILAVRKGVFSARGKAALVDLGMLLQILYLFHKANSATSLICFIVGTAILLFTEMPAVKRNIGRFGVYLVTFMLLFGALDVLFGIGENIVSAVGRDMTLTGRVDIWNEVISMSENTLVGSGHESFWLGNRAEKMWKKYYWKPNQAHNGYIETFLNLGLIGLALLLIMMVTGYKNILLKMTSNHTLGTLKMTLFLTALLYNFAEAAFRIGPVWFMLFLCCLDIETRRETETQRSAVAKQAGLRLVRPPGKVSAIARTNRESVGSI